MVEGAGAGAAAGAVPRIDASCCAFSMSALWSGWGADDFMECVACFVDAAKAGATVRARTESPVIILMRSTFCFLAT